MKKAQRCKVSVNYVLVLGSQKVLSNKVTATEVCSFGCQFLTPELFFTNMRNFFL